MLHKIQDLYERSINHNLRGIDFSFPNLESELQEVLTELGGGGRSLSRGLTAENVATIACQIILLWSHIAKPIVWEDGEERTAAALGFPRTFKLIPLKDLPDVSAWR